MEKNQKTALITSLITIAVYFSGLLVFITPLPFIYHQLKYKNSHFFKLVWPSLLFIVFVYFSSLESLNALYKSTPSLVWLIPVPFVGLTEFLPKALVASFGIAYYGLFLATAFLVSEALKTTQKMCLKISFWSILGMFLLIGLIAAAFILPNAGVVLTTFREYMTVGFEQFISAQEQAGLSLEKATQLRVYIPQYIENLFFLLPFMLFSIITFLFMINLLLAKRFFSPFFKNLLSINFTLFQIPFEVVWVTLGLVVVALLNQYSFNSSFILYTSLNLLFSLSIPYFFQGLAVLIHFLNRKKVSGIFRLFIYLFLIVMMQTTFIVITALGFFENWLDIRKLDAPKKPLKDKTQQ